MKNRGRFAWAGNSVAVLFAALAALIPLAWLQYRWIGRVSEFEGDRARAQLRTAAITFAQAFDERIRQPLAWILGERSGAPAPSLEEDLRIRLAQWQEAAIQPQLVRAVYLARPMPGGGLDLRRYDAAAQRFEPAAWPRVFEPLQSRMAAFDPGLEPEQLALPFVDDVVPAIAMPAALPRRRPRQPAPPRGARTRLSGPPSHGRADWIVVEFDAAGIRELLPSLFARLFPSAEPRYEAMVRSRTHPEAVFYRSDPSLPAAFFAVPDARAGLFEMRRELRRREGAARTAEGWEVLIRNRAGSLEDEIARTRRRNLSVSGGILLVLAASLGILVVSARRAQRLARLHIEFVAGVSHELKTPLAVICSAGENLADGVVTADAHARRYGEVIRGEGRRLSRMVEQILAFAGIERNRTRLELEPIEPQQVIARAVAMCTAEHAAERISVEAGDGLPLILADPISFAHCLRNLIENALVHGGGKPVSVRAQAVDGRVRIQVEDRGPGIEPEDLPHVFEAFYRGRHAVEDQVRGFGLGLTLVKHIVEAHSGTIAVSSRPGEGACFTVTVPAVPAPEA